MNKFAIKIDGCYVLLDGTPYLLDSREDCQEVVYQFIGSIEIVEVRIVKDWVEDVQNS